MIKNLLCWCGNHDLLPFSEGYFYCNNCKTLVLGEWADEKFFSVEKDEQDFYGKSYWFDHQQKDLGFDNILTRARTDLPERVLHWLATLLKYKIPPGSTLELGCSHGGFVSMLRWAGFQSTGTEMSPWVVDFARNTFQVPMLVGELEKQSLPAASLDVIALMDVLEHLPAPSATMSRCLELLKPDGVLLIQTPRYQEGRTYQQMLEEHDPFLEQFKPPEHVYLFSQSSVTELFRRLGAEHIIFEPAFFSQYDMFFVVSRSHLLMNTQEEIERSLMNTPGGRLVLALLDKKAESKNFEAKWQEAEFDREARLQVILKQGQEYSELQAQHQLQRQEYSELQAQHQQALYLLSSIRHTRLYRLLRRFGLCEWVESSMKAFGG